VKTVGLFSKNVQLGFNENDIRETVNPVHVLQLKNGEQQ
jgi:hypothetical protein